jgi:predicted dehydrogenase
VIGCGFQGQIHVESLQSLPEVEVSAVCDLDRDRAEALARSHGIERVHVDWRELVEQNDLDLLTICTMPNTHRDMAVAGAGRGMHVLCEKPMALNADEGAEMVSAARAAGTQLFVGFNMRHMARTEAVRNYIAADGLGSPLAARGWMLAADVPWWGRHYVKELSGGGALAATAVHVLDLVHWLVGSPLPLTASASMATVFPRKRLLGAPADAAARYDVDDLVFGHIRFEGGFFLSLEGAWTWDVPGWNYSFELVGDRGQAAFDPLRLVTDKDGRPGDVTSEYPFEDAGAMQEAFPLSVRSELAEIIAAIRTGNEPETTTTGAEALVTQAIVDALYVSAWEGHEREVRVPEAALTIPKGTSMKGV